MDNIVAEVMKIIKSAENNLSMEISLKQYFEQTVRKILEKSLSRIDRNLALAYIEEGWNVERFDTRIVQTTFGQISIRRRRMEKGGEHGFYPLDQEIGIRPYQRYSAYFEYTVARIAAKTVYRTTAETVNALTPVTLSHQQVMRIVRRVGNKYNEWEKGQELYLPEGPKRKPAVLYIEGDSLILRGQRNAPKELHRFQIAEGIQVKNGRRELTGTHYIASYSHSEAKKRMETYLLTRYDLKNTLVISNSDGGSGYSRESFEDILGKTKRHEHFRDAYHVNRKYKERVGWADKELFKELKKAIRLHIWEKTETVLSTIESTAATEEQITATQKLRDYLKRNWPYMVTMKQRGLEEYEKLIGTCESNHRTYSYRMKKQGRCWGKAGGSAMIHILTGLKNGDLEEAIISQDESLINESSEKFRGAVKMALKPAVWKEHEGVIRGRITLNAPSSSAVGTLIKSLVS